MADQTYTGLTVGIRYDEFDGTYVIGAEVGAAFVPFFRLKGGRLDKYLARAQQAQPTPAAAPEPGLDNPPVQ